LHTARSRLTQPAFAYLPLRSTRLTRLTRPIKVPDEWTDKPSDMRTTRPPKTTRNLRLVKSRPSDSFDVVVRRGADRRFSALTVKTADLPVTVSWDRRQGERRTVSRGGQTDRRESDRRQGHSFTWELADFVVIQRSKPRRSHARTRQGR
jgi:hypothetical protein